MKKFLILSVALTLFFLSSLAFAEKTKEFTGYDYLGLVKKQRAEVAGSFIKIAKKNGVEIKNDPVFYCKKLDAFYERHPDMKKEAFGYILKTLVIMEYDWSEKGIDKERIAREWLGEEVYKANKKRTGG